MMLPFIVTMIPTFVIFKTLGWVNTLYPLFIPAWFGGGAFNIFLFRQFFMTMPYELDEAARIDGAGFFRIYLRVLVPLAQPVFATVAIFSFIGPLERVSRAADLPQQPQPVHPCPRPADVPRRVRRALGQHHGRLDPDDGALPADLLLLPALLPARRRHVRHGRPLTLAARAHDRHRRPA